MKHEVVIDRFDDGLNTKVTPLQGKITASPDLQNVVFDDLGAVGTRNGYSVYGSVPIASAKVNGLWGYVDSSGTERLIAACYGSVWRASANTFVTIPSAQSVLTVGARVQAVPFHDKLWITNGQNNPYKFDGTYFTRWGVITCSAAIASQNSAGTLTGTYTYKVCGVNSSTFYGNMGSISNATAAASHRIYLTNIPVFPTSAGVNYKLICRNKAAVTTVYYVVTQIANADTTYADNLSDTTLTTYAPTDKGLPDQFTCVVEHLARIWGASSTSSTPSYLWYSEASEPETFKTTNFEPIGAGDGYKITGLVQFSSGIVISKSDGKGNGAMYYLYTPDNTPANWTLTKLDTGTGGSAESVMVKFLNYAMYMNKFGIFDLNETALGTVKSDALSFNIEPDIYALAASYVNRATAINWKNKVWVSVPYGSITYNNRVYQYDYVRGRGIQARELGAWSKFTNMKIGPMTVFGGALYGGSDYEDGQVYAMDSGHSDGSGAIDSYYKTMLILGKPEHQNLTKVWREARLYVECSGDWNMVLTYLLNFEDASGTTTNISLDPGGNLWGTFIWGTDIYDPGFKKRYVKISFLNAVSKSIQLKFSTNTAAQYFKVHLCRITYNLRGER